MGILSSRDTQDLPQTLASLPFFRGVPRSALRTAERDIVHYSVPGGWKLIDEGDATDVIQFVVSGSLGAFRRMADGRSEFLGHIRSGEPVGEMAFVSGETHRNSVYALRDTEIVSLGRRSFRKLVKADPTLMERLTKVILTRLRRPDSRDSSRRADPKVFALLATSPTIDLSLRASALKDQLVSMGLRVAIADEQKAGNNSRYFDDLETRHDIVIITASIGDSNWFRITVRHADRIWILARADARPSTPLMPDDNSPARQFKLVDLVLLHHGSDRKGADPEEWASAAQAARVFHWRGMNDDDCLRLARTISGRSVGLVLSGGGARAYAHIGAIRALREAGCPIDFIGGASMGAVIGACVAMGWKDDEIDRRIRAAFVDSNPLGDYHLPVVSLVRGRRVNARLEEHFGDVRIEDMDLPFFAVSTNLSHGAYRVHNRGVLRHALRASISLPGILPPVIDEGELLVDGAVLNNFPVDVMRELHRGRTIGIDVARAPDALDVSAFIDPPNFFEWTLENGFSAAPPIASLLMRTATLTVNPNAGRELTDMLVAPTIESVELRDWKRYDKAVEDGYLATRQAISQLTGPLANLMTARSG